MKGGVVPGGAERRLVCEIPVTCANDSSSLTLGWKKYFTTEVPLRDCDSVCSTSLTVVCALRSVPRIMRVAISSGDRPVYFHTVATTGILMLGKMSVGVRQIANMPSSVIAMASTMKVYGRLSASLTIHIGRFSPGDRANDAMALRRALAAAELATADPQPGAR